MSSWQGWAHGARGPPYWAREFGTRRARSAALTRGPVRCTGRKAWMSSAIFCSPGQCAVFADQPGTGPGGFPIRGQKWWGFPLGHLLPLLASDGSPRLTVWDLMSRTHCWGTRALGADPLASGTRGGEIPSPSLPWNHWDHSFCRSLATGARVPC